MGKKPKVHVPEIKDKTPRVTTSRKITLTFPDGHCTAYGFTDAHFYLTHPEADALADKLREAAAETRRGL